MSLSYLHVHIPSQQLLLIDAQKLKHRYSISSAKNGLGEQTGSERTPRGWHTVRAKIGSGAPINTVFVGRRQTAEIYNADLATKYPGRDWILTRILWLSGRDVGFNRLGQVDSMRRYIYIHGCPDSEPMGVPLSHGCIRMRNKDVVDLFDSVCVGTKVFIEE